MAVSEEVRSRCHVKHTLPRWPVESEPDLIAVDSENLNNQTVSILEPYLDRAFQRKNIPM